MKCFRYIWTYLFMYFNSFQNSLRATWNTTLQTTLWFCRHLSTHFNSLNKKFHFCTLQREWWTSKTCRIKEAAWLVKLCPASHYRITHENNCRVSLFSMEGCLESTTAEHFLIWGLVHKSFSLKKKLTKEAEQILLERTSGARLPGNETKIHTCDFREGLKPF